MGTQPTPEIAALLGDHPTSRDDCYPISLALFNVATIVPVALAIGGVEGFEGPKPDGAWFYGLEYAFWGLSASVVTLVLGSVALARCGRRRDSADGRLAFRITLGTAAVFAAAVVGMFFQMSGAS